LFCGKQAVPAREWFNIRCIGKNRKEKDIKEEHQFSSVIFQQNTCPKSRSESIIASAVRLIKETAPKKPDIRRTLRSIIQHNILISQTNPHILAGCMKLGLLL
jgi:hypothetical protein